MQQLLKFKINCKYLILYILWLLKLFLIKYLFYKIANIFNSYVIFYFDNIDINFNINLKNFCKIVIKTNQKITSYFKKKIAKNASIKNLINYKNNFFISLKFFYNKQ